MAEAPQGQLSTHANLSMFGLPEQLLVKITKTAVPGQHSLYVMLQLFHNPLPSCQQASG